MGHCPIVTLHVTYIDRDPKMTYSDPTLLKVLFMKQRIPQSEILEIKAYPQLRNKDMQEDIISTEFATNVTDFS